MSLTFAKPWTDEAACDECGDDITYSTAANGVGELAEDSDGECEGCGAKYTLCIEPEDGSAWSNRAPEPKAPIRLGLSIACPQCGSGAGTFCEEWCR